MLGVASILAGCSASTGTETSASSDASAATSEPVQTAEVTVTSTALDPEVSTTQASTTTAPPAATSVPPPTGDPCVARGYVTGAEGHPVEPDPDDRDSVYADLDGMTGPRGRVYDTDSLVLGGGYGDPRPFDWDEDGQPDQVSMGAGTVSVTTGSGIVSVSGVRTDFSEVGYHSSIHLAMPLDIGDVTGDGHVDLMVATGGWVGVLAGTGEATTAVTVAFDRIGIDAVGWLTPPSLTRSDDDGPPSMRIYLTSPNGAAEPVLLDDANGDGIAEIGVYNHLERTMGSFMLLLGQPCHP